MVEKKYIMNNNKQKKGRKDVWSKCICIFNQSRAKLENNIQADLIIYLQRHDLYENIQHNHNKSYRSFTLRFTYSKYFI